MKLQGIPMPINKGRFKFMSRYGCRGVLYFWLVEPKSYEINDQGAFETAKQTILNEFRARGEKHVYYYPMKPKGGER